MKRILFLFVMMLSCFISLKANEGTVVGIHGFLVTHRSLITLRKVLHCADFDVRLWEYNSRSKTIECHATDLIYLLKQISCEKPGQPIHFVTHSIGSWVLRSALNHPECPEEAKVGRAVLLAPPNRGIGLARRFEHFGPFRKLVGPYSGTQLVTFEAADVVRLGSFPCTMEVFVIAGAMGMHPFFTEPNDKFLTTEETWLETPFYYYELPINHSTILTNGKSLYMTRDFLLCGCIDQNY